jgi:hypothetical protein
LRHQLKDNTTKTVEKSITFITLHNNFSEIKRKQSIDQWNPLHPTDLGLILIGIDQLHGVEQTDHQEVFHPRFEGLLAVLFLHQMASNGPTVLASNGPTVLVSNGSTVLASNGPSVLAPSGPPTLASNGPSVLASNGPSVLAPSGPSILHHQLLAMMHIQFQETILLNHQALKACLTHPNETCLLCTTT